MRKFTDENKELAAQLHNQMKILQQKVPKSALKPKAGRANGSDFSSARGSEERHASVAAQSGRGPRRNRDYEVEQVSHLSLFLYSLCVSFGLRLCRQLDSSEVHFTSRHLVFLIFKNPTSLVDYHHNNCDSSRNIYQS